MTSIIAHTTDLSGDDALAFVHAAALAAASGTRLVTIHGNAPPELADRLPDAGPLGERWGCRIDHTRICHECCDDVTDTLLDGLRRVAPGLVVTGTHGRHGLAAVLRGSVSESLARNLAVPTLIVPNRGRGFVDEASGAIDLRRVLVPAVDVATAARGLAAARTLVALAGVGDAELIVLVVGDHALPAPVERDVSLVHVSGRLEDAVLAAARGHHACAIVMPTHGHDGVRDALFGSHTEQVVRHADCPVLTVPMHAAA